MSPYRFKGLFMIQEAFNMEIAAQRIFNQWRRASGDGKSEEAAGLLAQLMLELGKESQQEQQSVMSDISRLSQEHRQQLKERDFKQVLRRLNWKSGLPIVTKAQENLSELNALRQRHTDAAKTAPGHYGVSFSMNEINMIDDPVLGNLKKIPDPEPIQRLASDIVANLGEQGSKTLLSSLYESVGRGEAKDSYYIAGRKFEPVVYGDNSSAFEAGKTIAVTLGKQKALLLAQKIDKTLRAESNMRELDAWAKSGQMPEKRNPLIVKAQTELDRIEGEYLATMEKYGVI